MGDGAFPSPSLWALLRLTRMYSVHFNGPVHPIVNLPDRKAVVDVVRKYWNGSNEGCPVCVKQDGKEIASINGIGRIAWLS